MIEKLGGRKFLIAILLVLTSTGLLLVDKITQDTWSLVIGGIAIAYNLANVLNKAVK